MLDNTDLKNIQTPSTFGLEDPLLNNLLLELEKLNQERIGLNYSTKDTNPVVKVLDPGPKSLPITAKRRSWKT